MIPVILVKKQKITTHTFQTRDSVASRCSFPCRWQLFFRVADRCRGQPSHSCQQGEGHSPSKVTLNVNNMMKYICSGIRIVNGQTYVGLLVKSLHVVKWWGITCHFYIFNTFVFSLYLHFIINLYICLAVTTFIDNIYIYIYIYIYINIYIYIYIILVCIIVFTWNKLPVFQVWIQEFTANILTKYLRWIT